MKKHLLRVMISVMAIAGLQLGALVQFGSSASTGKVEAAGSPSLGLTQLQKRLLDGLASTELDPPISTDASAQSRNYAPDHADDQCSLHQGDNTKVNQNCLNLSDTDLQGRGQANNETSIAQDPNNLNHIVASYNGYRTGDGNCVGAYTLDGGKHWNDSTIPMGFTRGAAFGGVARQYWQAGGDTSVAWDSKGNAYLNCMVFMRGPGVTNSPDQSSGIYLFRSTGNSGASWNFPGRPVVEQSTVSALPFLDKPYMTVDNHASSPFRDRIYVTWTLFGTDGTVKIFEAHSNDYGQTFSPPVLVSTPSSLCPSAIVGTNNCDASDFSQPFTGSDGNIYVVYNNFNNSLSSANDNHNQILLSKSTDGGVTFNPPVLVANFNDLPDCATYQGGQDFGRACVPEKGTATNSVFRAANYPSGAVNTTNASQVIVTFGSYINADSQPSNACIPTGLNSSTGLNLYTGVKTVGACNNKVLESVSTNGGTSFNGNVTDPTTLPIVSSTPGQKTTDQWWQWASFTKSGKLVISYYDRQYNDDEFNGHMDISLSSSKTSGFDVLRVTSSSMPLPTQFPDSQGNSLFFGDYTGLSAVNSTAFPLWMDTRDKDLALCPSTATPGVPPAVCSFTEPNGLVANDQDIFTKAVNVP